MRGYPVFRVPSTLARGLGWQDGRANAGGWRSGRCGVMSRRGKNTEGMRSSWAGIDDDGDDATRWGRQTDTTLVGVAGRQWGSTGTSPSGPVIEEEGACDDGFARGRRQGSGR
jgi:hypothetical protein